MYKKIVIHHTAIPQNQKPQLSRVNEAHKAKGFYLSKLGYYVGYHFLIEENGAVIQTRRITEVGCHNSAMDKTTGTGYNFSSIGICLAGNFDMDSVKDAQSKALITLMDSIKSQLGISVYDKDNVLYHRETKATACPGAYFIDKERLLGFVNKKSIDTTVLSNSWDFINGFIDKNEAVLGLELVSEARDIQSKLAILADNIRKL